MTETIQQCNDNNPKTKKVEFDAGNSIKNDTVLLCENCYNKPPFDKYILKVMRLRN